MTGAMNKAMKILAGMLALIAATSMPVRAAGPNEAQPPADTAVPSEPQQTSASFGDWVVRCDRPPQAGAKRVCEAAQALVIKGQQGPIAQIAFGHPPLDKGIDPALSLTVLLPVNVAFDKVPRLGPGNGPDDAGAATLTYRRCLPGGCLADVKPDAALLRALQAAPKPGHLTFTDAGERTLTLPVSFRGLTQALDDLNKETAKDGGAVTR